jgi:DNA replication ATP-dependent helicase Dna2
MKLTVQGRMHEQLQAFPSEHFYLGNLTVMDDSQRVPIQQFHSKSPLNATGSASIRAILGQHRLVFIPTPAIDTHRSLPILNTMRISPSKAHALEATRVVKLVELIADEYGTDFTRKTVGVITPWRAQTSLIKSLVTQCLGQRSENVTVDTIERFQGSTRDIIVVSFCINRSQQLQAVPKR